jgi:cytochrome c-type biogenesis protein CcmF
MTIAAIDTRWLGDLYVSLGEPVSGQGQQGAWGMRIYLKPFVDWIWAGAFLMALGGFLTVSDRRYRFVKRKAFAGVTTEVRAAAGAD